jgi:hypothetical protein
MDRHLCVALESGSSNENSGCAFGLPEIYQHFSGKFYNRFYSNL